MSHDKNKLKNSPVGAIRYWWNLYLFARGFEFEINSPPATVAEQLAALHNPRRRFISVGDTRSRTAKVTTEDDDVYTFDVRSKRVSNSVTYTSVRASGRVIYSQGYGTTIVRGLIRLGWLYLSALIISLVAFLGGLVVAFTTGEDAASMLVMTPVFAVFVAFYFWQIRKDYTALTRDLMQSVSAGAIQSLDDLVADDDDDSPFVDEPVFEPEARTTTHEQ